jgi:hypothetical protein
MIIDLWSMQCVCVYIYIYIHFTEFYIFAITSRNIYIDINEVNSKLKTENGTQAW